MDGLKNYQLDRKLLPGQTIGPNVKTTMNLWATDWKDINTDFTLALVNFRLVCGSKKYIGLSPSFQLKNFLLNEKKTHWFFLI